MVDQVPVAARRWPLVASMFLAIALVTGLAWWDEQREAEAALLDLETEQSILAASVAGSLRAHLATVTRDATPDVRPDDLFEREPRLVRRDELMVFVVPPGDPTLHGMDGRIVSSAPLRQALDRDASTVRLSRPEAAEIGLPARTSMAGLAHVDAGALGRWGVVVVASAARERDREKRAMGRLVLGVLLAAGLVLAFGGAALRRQRKELELLRELAVAEVEGERDAELQRAGRVATMGTFAMGIAHEVATPLGVIVGRAEQLMARVQDDERATRNAQSILQQADRIQHIVRRFLDLARGGPPSLERADPAEVVRAATDAVEHRFAKATVTLSADIPGSMPPIRCDRDLLEQAVVNLLLNACEACGPGGHVEITVHSDAERVAVVVTDDGVGISAENAQRAREPFFTTKHAVNGPIGAGLGLAIATEIVKSHRGELTIGPGAGKGTRACIEIPIAAASGDARAA
jgi:two-component system, NtrC family, sensor kinase